MRACGQAWMRQWARAMLALIVGEVVVRDSAAQNYAEIILNSPSLSTTVLLPFDEMSGTVAHDLAAAPTNGTYVGSPTLGVLGDDYGMVLDGAGLGSAFRAASEKYCSIPPDKMLGALGSDWTLNVWMRFNGSPGTPPDPQARAWFGSEASPTSHANTFLVATQSRADGLALSDYMSVFIRPPGGATYVGSEVLTYGTQFDGHWHLVTIVYRAAQTGSIQIGMDGTLGTAASGAAASLPTAMGAMGIGAFVSAGVAASNACPFDFANLSFHTRAFSAADLFSLGEIYNGRTGALVYHADAAIRLLHAASDQRIGISMIGDSNVVRSFVPPGATQSDQGYLLSTATWIKQATGSPLAAIMVGANGPSNGSVPLLGVFSGDVASPDTGAHGPPQHVLIRHLAQWNTDGNPNPEPYGFEPDALWRGDAEHMADSSNAGTKIDPSDPNWPFQPGTPIRVSYDFATFDSAHGYTGAGLIYPNLKIGATVVGGAPINTKTGVDGWSSGSLDAGPLVEPAYFRLQTAAADAIGPFAAGYTFIENAEQRNDFTLNVLWAYGGKSAYTVCQALSNTEVTPLLKLTTYFQRLMTPTVELGQTPTGAVQILQGQNDLNTENTGTVSSYVYTPGTDVFSSSGNAGASSREGYKNDLLTIINRLKDAWVAAGYSAADFYVILGPYHQISPAPGNWRMELGCGRAEREIADAMDNVIVLDGPKIAGYDAMMGVNGYSADGAGQAHLSRAGYVLMGSATGALALGPLNPLGACCTGTTCSVTTQAGCAAAFQGMDTTCDTTGGSTTCCRANFNHVNGLDVQDIFDFLTAWFALDPGADFNGVDGVEPLDIFDFLAAWFAGCD